MQADGLWSPLHRQVEAPEAHLETTAKWRPVTVCHKPAPPATRDLMSRLRKRDRRRAQRPERLDKALARAKLRTWNGGSWHLCLEEMRLAPLQENSPLIAFELRERGNLHGDRHLQHRHRLR